MLTFDVQYQLKVRRPPTALLMVCRPPTVILPAPDIESDLRTVAGVGPGEGGLVYDEPRRGQVVQEEEGMRLRRAAVCDAWVRAIMRIVWVQHRKGELCSWVPQRVSE